MKSDISRQTFNARKHYSRVVMQQGRVQLDADWNEQQNILLHRIETETGDTIGSHGVSADSNGFAVRFTPDHSDLVISPGYMYVNGMLCELEQETAFPVRSVTSGYIQLDPSEIEMQAFQPGRWIELLDATEQLFGLLKITDVKEDITKQLVTLSTDQSGQTIPDWETRLRNVRPVMTYLTQPNYPQADKQISGLAIPDNKNLLLVYLDIWERDVTPFDDPAIREVALGGADTAHRSQTLWQIKVQSVPITANDLLDALKQNTGQLSNTQRYELWQRISGLLRISTFRPPLSQWQAPHNPYTGKLRAHTTPINGSDIPSYRGLENQLYHIEIHQGTAEGARVEFKWARNNASSLVAAKIENGTVTIQGSGQGNLLGLVVGQYVELLDEQTELLGLSGSLAQIKQVDDITGQLTLEPPPAENSQATRLRLWNGRGFFYADQDGNWLPLEGGIEIQFTPGTYITGNYWLIPARSATSTIEWPYSAPQPPQGIQHHYARLSCLLHSPSLWLHQDCRSRFFPMTADALHILDINWKNDVLNQRHLLKEGLQIVLDREPDPACAGAMQAAMIVSIEAALPGGGAGVFLINGHFEILGNVIKWHWEEEREGLLAKFFGEFDEFRHRLLERPQHHLRVRVTLKGHYIWHTINGRHIYLDGETFGKPGTIPSGHMPLPQKEPGPHIDLQFPSGAGRPASDFESWFYMRE